MGKTNVFRLKKSLPFLLSGPLAAFTFFVIVDQIDLRQSGFVPSPLVLEPMPSIKEAAIPNHETTTHVSKREEPLPVSSCTRDDVLLQTIAFDQDKRPSLKKAAPVRTTNIEDNAIDLPMPIAHLPTGRAFQPSPTPTRGNPDPSLSPETVNGAPHIVANPFTLQALPDPVSESALLFRAIKSQLLVDNSKSTSHTVPKTHPSEPDTPAVQEDMQVPKSSRPFTEPNEVVKKTEADPASPANNMKDPEHELPAPPQNNAQNLVRPECKDEIPPAPWNTYKIRNFRSFYLQFLLMQLARADVPCLEFPLRKTLINTLLSDKYEFHVNASWDEDAEELEIKLLRRNFVFDYLRNVPWQDTRYERLFLGDNEDLHQVDLDAFDYAMNLPLKLGIVRDEDLDCNAIPPEQESPHNIF